MNWTHTQRAALVKRAAPYLCCTLTPPTKGRVTFHTFAVHDSRYHYDRALLSLGFKQYDTDQDAWYFGTWVHPQAGVIVTYAEGDEYVTLCADDSEMQIELTELAKFHGPAPAAWILYDEGGVTYFYDERPTLEVGQ